MVQGPITQLKLDLIQTYRPVVEVSGITKSRGDDYSMSRVQTPLLPGLRCELGDHNDGHINALMVTGWKRRHGGKTSVAPLAPDQAALFDCDAQRGSGTGGKVL